VLHTDFTELRLAGGTQKVYQMPIVGRAGKVAFGWDVGRRTNRTLALHGLAGQSLATISG
jgi:hypothetical protein